MTNTASSSSTWREFGVGVKTPRQKISAESAFSRILEDALGNVTSQKLGNRTITRSHNQASGRLQSVISIKGSDWATSDRLALTYDALGNLTSRHRTSGNPFAPDVEAKEHFCYDPLNRLTKVNVGTLTGGCGNPQMTYDAFGNLTKHNGQTYTYPGVGAIRPHAVTKVGGTTYAYDANGNMSGGDGRTFTYSAFDQMSKVTKGSNNTLAFTYGIDRQRNYRRDTVGGVTTTTYYLGAAERVEKGTTTEIRRRIGGEVVVIEKLNSDGTVQTPSTKRRFQMLDHLGSPVAVYDNNATMKERLSFGAWGNRRNYETLAALPPYNTSFTTETARGYTGHEHGDAFGIIHMNGRIYDPNLGRMLQADPFIDGVTNTQGYNRYSYVGNNPLSYTDPSGYFKFKDFVGIAVAAVGFWMCGPNCGQIGWQISIGAAAGGAQAAASGGDIGRGIVTGGISGAAFYGVGEAAGATYGSGAIATRVVGYGAVGGVASVISGGEFHHGFITAGAGGLIPGAGGSFDQMALRTIGRAIVGGTVSEITGGKFANGAATAAFASIVAEGVAASRTPQEPLMGPVNPDVRIGPSGTLDINSPDYQLEFSMAVDFTTPAAVAPIGVVPSVDPNSGFRFATASPSVPGASLGSASGYYGTELMPGMPSGLVNQLQMQVLVGAAAPVAVGGCLGSLGACVSIVSQVSTAYTGGQVIIDPSFKNISSFMLSSYAGGLAHMAGGGTAATAIATGTSTLATFGLSR